MDGGAVGEVACPTLRNVLEGGRTVTALTRSSGAVETTRCGAADGNEYLSGGGGKDGLDGGIGADTCLQGTGSGAATACER